MKSIFTLLSTILISILFFTPSFAQESAEETEIQNPWTVEFRGGLNGSQAAYSNWQQGGVNTIAVTGNTNFKASYKKDVWGYTLNTALTYGRARIGDDNRKTDDEINIRNRFDYFFSTDEWSARFNLNFLSQFDRGFNADDVKVSQFFAPAYLTQTLGVAYTPTNFFNVSTSLAMRQTFVNDTDLSVRYGLKPGETFQNEFGFSLEANFEREIMENVRYVSRLETFTNFQKSPNSSDFTFKNELVAQINSYLSTNLQITLLYNDDVSKDLQVRQILSVGLTFRFI